MPVRWLRTPHLAFFQQLKLPVGEQVPQVGLVGKMHAPDASELAAAIAAARVGVRVLLAAGVIGVPGGEPVHTEKEPAGPKGATCQRQRATDRISVVVREAGAIDHHTEAIAMRRSWQQAADNAGAAYPR